MMVDSGPQHESFLRLSLGILSASHLNTIYLHRGSGACQTTEPVGGGQGRMSVFPRNEPLSANKMFCFSNRHRASWNIVQKVSCGFSTVSPSSEVDIFCLWLLSALLVASSLYKILIKSSRCPIKSQSCPSPGGRSTRHDARASTPYSALSGSVSSPKTRFAGYRRDLVTVRSAESSNSH